LKHGSGRGAGNIYTEGDILYRPIQKSINFYGERVQVNQILELSENDFIETKVKTLEPAFGIGTHHICSMEGFTIMDIKRCNS
jgi:hypothetical protein